jgi:hypothetical protein
MKVGAQITGRHLGTVIGAEVLRHAALDHLVYHRLDDAEAVEATSGQPDNGANLNQLIKKCSFFPSQSAAPRQFAQNSQRTFFSSSEESAECNSAAPASSANGRLDCDGCNSFAPSSDTNTGIALSRFRN